MICMYITSGCKTEDEEDLIRINYAFNNQIVNSAY